MTSISEVPKDGEGSKEPPSPHFREEGVRCGGMAGDCLIRYNWILFSGDICCLVLSTTKKQLINTLIVFKSTAGTNSKQHIH